VTFDIDANGIVHVSAKDKATGKEQKIRIEASSGISEADIQRMVKEAEANADSDKKEKEKAEVHNQAEHLVYSVDKLLKEHGDKISADEKAKVQEAFDALKKVQKSENLEEVKAATARLEEASHKLSEAMAKATAESAKADGSADPQPAEPGPGKAGTGKKPEGDKAVDADYEVVD